MAFEQLKQLQQQQGFDASAAWQAAQDGVALADRSHWGQLRLAGGDRLSFLHNQSTNALKALTPGQGCETVFVTATARTIDLATAYVLEDSLRLLVSPSRREPLLKLLDRYIFFGDAVSLGDDQAATACFSLIGPRSHSLITQLTGQDFSREPEHSHRSLALAPIPGPTSEPTSESTSAPIPVQLANGSGLGLPGYTLFCPADRALELWVLLGERGAIALAPETWEQLRIRQGRPAPDQELTEDYNPLEAGLWQTISFDKGCYIGQETIARLNTYNGVKTRLWGIQLSAPAAPGSAITLAGTKIGQLTSLSETPEGLRGLGYIRTKAGGAGLKVQVGEAEALVLPLDYVSHPSDGKLDESVEDGQANQGSLTSE